MERGDGGLGTLDHVLEDSYELLEGDGSLNYRNPGRKSGDHCILGDGLMAATGRHCDVKIRLKTVDSCYSHYSRCCSLRRIRRCKSRRLVSLVSKLY